MCNYSLKVRAKEQKAQVGDHLEVRAFPNGPYAPVRGFAKVDGKPNTVVCLKPGTEIAFDRRPLFLGSMTWVECDNGERMRVTDVASSCVARLRHPPRPLGGFQIEVEDVLEFADGMMIAVACLQVGDRAKVLQVPIKRRRVKKGSVNRIILERERVE